MTHSATSPNRMFDLAEFARTGLGLVAQLIAGIMLVILAGIFAIAAFAGVLLAMLAVVVRFSGTKRRRQPYAPDDSGVITLDARRTPRGWTVE